MFSQFSTDQDLLPSFVFALYLFAQVSVRDLQILSHLPVVIEEGQVAILDSDQLQEEVRMSDCDYRSSI